MSAASPITGAINEPRIIYGREAYMPEFTPAFTESELDLTVLDKGKPLPFTIRQVLPERRWAIQNSGELLPELEYERRYLLWAERVVRGNPPRIIPIRASNQYFDRALIAIPTARRFVNVAFDYQGREIEIGFDPDKLPNPKAQKFELLDASGNSINPMLPQSNAKIDQLTVIEGMQARGVLDEEAARAERQRILGEPVITSSAPPQGFTQTEATEPERISVTAKCGKSCASLAGMLAHERSCAKCKDVPVVTEETDAEPE